MPAYLMNPDEFEEALNSTVEQGKQYSLDGHEDVAVEFEDHDYELQVSCIEYLHKAMGDYDGDVDLSVTFMNDSWLEEFEFEDGDFVYVTDELDSPIDVYEVSVSDRPTIRRRPALRPARCSSAGNCAAPRPDRDLIGDSNLTGFQGQDSSPAAHRVAVGAGFADAGFVDTDVDPENPLDL